MEQKIGNIIKENLPRKDAEVAVPAQKTTTALAVAGLTTKAVEVRRTMAEDAKVVASLDSIEKLILDASTKTLISEMSDEDLIKTASGVFRLIANDVGYKIPPATEWQYIQTRLLLVLKRYYGYYSMNDVKLAFEMAVMGELDYYLPKNTDGTANIQHYQNFNPEYLARIMNAYKKKHSDVVQKCINARPTERKFTDAEIEALNAEKQKTVAVAYAEYINSKNLSVSALTEKIIYEYLLDKRLCKEISDRNINACRDVAWVKYLERVASGFVPKMEAKEVKAKGKTAKELDYLAYDAARHNIIIEAFDNMITNNIKPEEI